MLSRFGTTISDLLLSIARIYTVPQLLGFAAMLTAVVIVSARRGHDPGRFFRRPFLTDVAYTVWFPIYTIMIGIPFSLALGAFVAHHAPFLRFRLLQGLPWWISIPVWLIVSDFVLYWMHRSLHRLRWLWALHKIHHAPTELSPLTTWREHWLEFMYLSCGGFVTSLVLGEMTPLHPIAIAFLAASQLAQHSDLDWTYGPLGRLVVSPRFHARHHSRAAEDLNVNFGFLLILWDELFGTARKVPGRAAAYGLQSDNHVPASFFLQLVYPLSLLVVKPPVADVPRIARSTREV
jgi:sterol desaturase/sphingolipid hydroxylase (fatty acid hydroxylase superfamily)